MQYCLLIIIIKFVDVTLKDDPNTHHTSQGRWIYLNNSNITFRKVIEGRVIEGISISALRVL